MTNKLLASVLSAFFPDQCTGCESPLFAEDSRAVSAADTLAADTLAADTLAADTLGSPQVDHSEIVLRINQRRWCAECWAELGLVGRLQCDFCAAEIRAVNPLGEGCPLCLGADLRFNQAVCLGNYAGLLRDLVVRMKNQRDDHLAVRLGQVLADKASRQPFFGSVDLVVPVPTHWSRRLMRGFCAAEILSESLAERAKVRLTRRLVRMNRSTEKQGKLSIAKRRKNMVGVFELAAKADVAGKVVLLVDDVMTSGATASELAKCLKKAKAKAVYVAAVARGAGVI